jgi:hypothetical protein
MSLFPRLIAEGAGEECLANGLYYGPLTVIRVYKYRQS